MKKKLISTLLAITILNMLSITAFAADGDEATGPKGAGTATDSTGAAIVTGDGVNFNTSGDDDAIPKATDTTGADISVWAKVLDSSTPTYKIDIAWGAMKFEFNSGVGTWDTTSHTYEGGLGTAKWTEIDYLDGQNNKIAVTNHSNHAVNTKFAYAMENQIFNATNGPSAVVGNFFADNTKAIEASKVLDNTSAVSDKLTDSKLSLHTADKYFKDQNDKDNTAYTPVFNDANKATTGRQKDVFFAFSGKPDEGRGVTLDNFKKVGVITVTVSKMAEADLSGFEF